MPVGALLGGLVAEAWGLAAVYYGATVVCVGAVAYVALRVNQSLVATSEAEVP